MDEWEAMGLPRTAASYYMQRGAGAGAVSVSGSGTQLDSPLSAHGVNALAGLSQEESVKRKRGRPRKRGLSSSQGEPAEVSKEEPKYSPPRLSQGESVKRKPGRPRKLELSPGEPNASAEVSPEEESKSPPVLSQGESVKRKPGRPRKHELSPEESKSQPVLSQGESVKRKPGRPRKCELSQGEPDTSAEASPEESKSPPGLSLGESIRRKPERPRKRKLELSPGEPDASPGVSQEEPNAPTRMSQGELVRRKPGRPRKHGPDGMVGLPNQNLPVQSNLGGNSAGSGSAFQPNSSSPISAHGVNVSAGISQGEPIKRRKPGRPRKYESDGKRRPGRPQKKGIYGPVSLGGNSAGSAFQLDPSSPILAHGVNASASEPARRRRPGRPRKKGLSSVSSPPHGEWLSGSAGIGLTPDIITIEVGEDIAKKVMLFLQQGPRVVCILSANGAVSTVTLRQPSTSSDTVKYEGHYEILWLSGSYMLTGNDGSRSRTGGLSVSLCSHDGQVICGAVDEMLVAATPVQVIVGSFMCSGSKTKPSIVVTISESSLDSESSVDGDKSVTPADHPSGDTSGDKSVTPTDHPSGDKSVTPTDHPSGDTSGDKSVTSTDHPSGDKSVPPTDHPSGDKSVSPSNHHSTIKSVSSGMSRLPGS